MQPILYEMRSSLGIKMPEKIDIKKLLAEKQAMIDKVIEKYIPRKFTKQNLEFICGKPRFEHNTEAPQKAIAEPVWDFLDRGGKRWRPYLFLTVVEALGSNPEKFIDFVVIPEVVHNATLMHDDIEDSSKERRGKLCTYILFGIDIAVNAGHTMFYMPLLSLIRNRNKIDSETLLKIYEIYAQEMNNLGFGQAMDIAWHRGIANADAVSENEYLQMCAYKTGTLARMSAKIAAVLAGADEKTVEKLGHFAESIGVAFQIQDDILNIVGEKFAEKKGGFGEDITEGKRSLMVINTLQKANAQDRKRLIEMLNMHTLEQKLRNEAIAIIKKYGAVEYAKNFARKMVEETWGEVDKILKPSPAKEKLKAFAYYLIEREI